MEIIPGHLVIPLYNPRTFPPFILQPYRMQFLPQLCRQQHNAPKPLHPRQVCQLPGSRPTSSSIHKLQHPASHLITKVTVIDENAQLAPHGQQHKVQQPEQLQQLYHLPLSRPTLSPPSQTQTSNQSSPISSPW